MFLLGMIIGFLLLVEEELFFLLEGVYFLCWLLFWEFWCFFVLVGFFVFIMIVVFIFVLLLVLMVNFVWVCIFGFEVFGMDVKLDSWECCWFFRGDVFLFGWEGWFIIGWLVFMLVLFISCDCG